MMDSLSQVEPVHWFMFVGVVSLVIARYGTHLVMPGWIEFTLRWGGWALLFVGLMHLLGVLEYLDFMPF